MYVPYAANVEFCDLPEEFNLQNIPMLSSEIVLLNMVPMDQFPKWPLEAEDRMCSMFRLDSNQIKRGNYKFRAEFVLNVENIFFVRRIQKMKKMVSEDQPLDWTGRHPHITSPPFWHFLTPPPPLCHQFYTRYKG